MAALRPLDSYLVRVAELGNAIREHRLAKGWKQAELAKAVALSPTAISHFENGSHVPRRDVTRRIDDALDAGGRLWRFRDELDDNPDAKWIARYLREQSKAATIRQITGFVPAMLETEEHTQLALEAGMPFYGGNLQDKIDYRAKMRAILRKPQPPTLRVVMWESALHTMAGDTRVKREQLLHLIKRSHDPNVELRLLPFHIGSIFMYEGFATIIGRPRSSPLAHRAIGRLGKFTTNQTSVAELTRLYDHLHDLALAPDESRAFLRKTVEELPPCP